MRPGARLPLFSLPSSRGVALGPKQYRQRKHLVLLCLDPETADGRTYLAAMADVYPEFQEMDAEVLALVPVAPATLPALVADLRLPFPLLADDGSARARLLPAGAPAPTVAMFVADRYGVLVHTQQRTRCRHIGAAGRGAGLGALYRDAVFRVPGFSRRLDHSGPRRANDATPAAASLGVSGGLGRGSAVAGQGEIAVERVGWVRPPNPGGDHPAIGLQGESINPGDVLPLIGPHQAFVPNAGD